MALSERDQVVQLIVEKCLLNCQINESKTKVFLDTRAQLSLISKAWLNTHLNELKVSEKEGILDPCDMFRVHRGNHAEIPFVGCVSINFELAGQGDERLQRYGHLLWLLKKLYSSQF